MNRSYRWKQGWSFVWGNNKTEEIQGMFAVKSLSLHLHIEECLPLDIAVVYKVDLECG